jgi:hypothetical protein
MIKLFLRFSIGTILGFFAGIVILFCWGFFFILLGPHDGQTKDKIETTAILLGLIWPFVQYKWYPIFMLVGGILGLFVRKKAKLPEFSEDSPTS